MTLPRESRARLWVGTSGWPVDHWCVRFHRRALARRDWFSHSAAHCQTVEINSTFHGLPGGRASTPGGRPRPRACRSR